MDQGFIDSLLKANAFSSLDIHFAKLMAGLSGKGTQELFLAAALASHYKGEGNICFDLSSMAGKRLKEEDPESLACPKLDKWLGILRGEEVVGKPGEYRPLVLDGGHSPVSPPVPGRGRRGHNFGLTVEAGQETALVGGPRDQAHVIRQQRRANFRGPRRRPRALRGKAT